MRRTDILERKEEILQWIEEGISRAEIARRLNCNIKTLPNAFKEMDIVYAGNQSGKGQHKSNGREMPLLEYLANSKDIQNNKVRKKLLDEGYKEYKCESCGLTTWLDQPIPLELHHIDGNHYNNSLDNFQLLCPNCHAFTSSYRGKNSAK